MKCGECDYYQFTGKIRHSSTIDGSCQNPKIPFPLVSSQSECVLTRSKLKCKDCDYWVEAEMTTREEDCGGCTYGDGYYPMFLNECCSLKEPHKSKVEK